MAIHRTRPRELLGELIEEARWVNEIGSLGGGAGPVRGGELDAMLEALMQAQQLRRRLVKQLERERRSGQGCDWAETDRDRGPSPRRRVGEREAS